MVKHSLVAQEDFSRCEQPKEIFSDVSFEDPGPTPFKSFRALKQEGISPFDEPAANGEYLKTEKSNLI